MMLKTRTMRAEEFVQGPTVIQLIARKLQTALNVSLAESYLAGFDERLAILRIYKHFYPQEYAQSTAHTMPRVLENGRVLAYSEREIELFYLLERDKLFPFNNFMPSDNCTDRLSQVPIEYAGIDAIETDDWEDWRMGCQLLMMLGGFCGRDIAYLPSTCGREGTEEAMAADSLAGSLALIEAENADDADDGEEPRERADLMNDRGWGYTQSTGLLATPFHELTNPVDRVKHGKLYRKAVMKHLERAVTANEDYGLHEGVDWDGIFVACENLPQENPMSALWLVLAEIDRSTGNIFLDGSPYQDHLVDLSWSVGTVGMLIEEWKACQEIQARTDRLIEWIEADPENFAQIVDLWNSGQRTLPGPVG